MDTRHSFSLIVVIAVLVFSGGCSGLFDDLDKFEFSSDAGLDADHSNTEHGDTEHGDTDHGDTDCSDGGTLCDDQCVDTDENVEHCGACGVVCDDPDFGSPICVAGDCEIDCDDGFDECDGLCIDFDSDPSFCGGCDDELACDNDEVCDDGSCTVECDEDRSNCDGNCVDLNHHPQHCGTCDSPCDAATPICADGDCIECGDHSDCSGELPLCSDEDECVECNDTADCGDCQSCIGNECVDNCDEATPQCIEDQCVECTTADHCGTDESCVDNECVCDDPCDGIECGSKSNACSDNAECGECDDGQICDANQCIADIDCSNDDQCPACQTCQGGTCSTEVNTCGDCELCNSEGNCISLCDEPTPHCIEDMCVECTITSHCGVDESCVDNECICNDPCEGLECGSSSNACDDAECGECDDQYCDTDQNLCVECTDDNHCENDQICDDNQCLEDVFCSDDNQCDGCQSCHNDTCTTEFHDCGDCYTCQSDGECSFDCEAPTSVCFEEECVQCFEPEQCASNESCDVDSNMCVCEDSRTDEEVCSDAGVECGTVEDNCEETVECGGCDGCQVCDATQCVDNDAECDSNQVCEDSVCLFSCEPGDEPFGGGNGSPDNPYTICTADHLNAISGDSNYVKADFFVANDIDMGTDIINIIGSRNAPFEGTFNGNGRTISSATIGSSAAPQSDAGLFGVIDVDGSVTDLTIDVVQVHGSKNVGGLVGENRGTIDHCHVQGDIDTSADHVGGLVGENRGTIANSTVNATVTGDYAVGGLVGRQFASDGDNATIESSSSDGTVNGLGLVGGLVGLNEDNSYITASHSSSDVNGVDPSGVDSSLGGLVGENYNSITTSYATGAVEGQSSVGGLVGENYGTITTSYATGMAQGQSAVGGLIGTHGHLTTVGDSHISDCYAVGVVRDKSTSKEGDSFGGLVGEVQDQSFVQACYSAGPIQVSNGDAGGLIGAVDDPEAITEGYWDSESSDISSSAAGESLTTIEFADESFWNEDSGWKFSDNWKMGFTPSPDEEERPILQWQDD